jgi:hypothetical protein
MCQSWKRWAALLAILLVNVAPTNADTRLRFQFTAGDRLNYVIEQAKDTTTTVDGKDLKSKSTMAIHLTWETIKVDDRGNAQIKITVHRVKMGSEGGQFGKVEVDSKDTSGSLNPTAQLLEQRTKAITSMEMTSTMSQAGQMKDVKFSEAWLEKFKTLNGPAGLAAPGGEMFGSENLKSMVSQVYLPTESVEKGKSWTQRFEMKLPLRKIVGDYKYTYEGPVEKAGRKLERIALVPNIKIESKPDAPFRMTIKSNKTKGHILFDNVAGRTALVSNEGTMEMEIEVADSTIREKTVQKMTMRLKKSAGGGEKGESRSK